MYINIVLDIFSRRVVDASLICNGYLMFPVMLSTTLQKSRRRFENKKTPEGEMLSFGNIWRVNEDVAR